MITLRRVVLVAFWSLCSGCGPSSTVDVSERDGSGGSDSRDGTMGRDGTADVAGTGGSAMGGTGGSAMGGTGGSPAGGTGGAGDAAMEAPRPDVAIDQMIPVDRAPDVLPPDMMQPPPDAGPRVALLVAGSFTDPTAGDMQLRTMLMARGFATVRLVADGTALPDLSDVSLLVIASSCDAAVLGNKYRTATVPALVMEAASFVDMGMTAGPRDTNFGENNATQITIGTPTHPMAAGLMNDVAVVTMTSPITWGVPAASAERVAGFAGMPNRATIFGYAKGAMMVGLAAPAVRVGFFPSDPAATRLTDNGKKLLNAAIDWALLP
jgi:hypothetical protein